MFTGPELTKSKITGTILILVGVPGLVFLLIMAVVHFQLHTVLMIPVFAWAIISGLKTVFARKDLPKP